jgi:hypothetical protein
MDLLEDFDVQCPYCGEVFAITVDTSQGSHSMTEDCVVCCRPIHFRVDCAPGEVFAVSGTIG